MAQGADQPPSSPHKPTISTFQRAGRKVLGGSGPRVHTDGPVTFQDAGPPPLTHALINLTKPAKLTKSTPEPPDNATLPPLDDAILPAAPRATRQPVAFPAATAAAGAGYAYGQPDDDGAEDNTGYVDIAPHSNGSINSAYETDSSEDGGSRFLHMTSF